jgi:hypothetical protein
MRRVDIGTVGAQAASKIVSSCKIKYLLPRLKAVLPFPPITYYLLPRLKAVLPFPPITYYLESSSTFSTYYLLPITQVESSSTFP